MPDFNIEEQIVEARKALKSDLQTAIVTHNRYGAVDQVVEDVELLSRLLVIQALEMMRKITLES